MGFTDVPFDPDLGKGSRMNGRECTPGFPSSRSKRDLEQNEKNSQVKRLKRGETEISLWSSAALSKHLEGLGLPVESVPAGPVTSSLYDFV